MNPDQNSFIFSTARASEVSKDLDLQIAALETHVDKVVKLTEINNLPIVSYILQVTHDKEDLERLADGLKKIAPHVSKLEDLRRKKAVFDLAVNDPTWMQWAFGDFGEFIKELDTLDLSKDS